MIRRSQPGRTVLVRAAVGGKICVFADLRRRSSGSIFSWGRSPLVLAKYVDSCRPISANIAQCHPIFFLVGGVSGAGIGGISSVFRAEFGGLNGMTFAA